MLNKPIFNVPNYNISEGLPDIQNQEAIIHKRINKVGIDGLKLPLQVDIKGDGVFNTIATVNSYSSLSEKLKGTNMSRYGIVLMESFAEINFSIKGIQTVMDRLAKVLDTEDVYIKVKFNYLILKKAPKSHINSYFNVPCKFEGIRIQNPKGDPIYNIYMTNNVNYTSLCPCSKEISANNAHNQRSVAEITTQLKHTGISQDTLFIEDVVDIVEKHASAPIRNVLKRADEKYQTELMYERPRFVEDMVRLISTDLDALLDKKILDYIVIVKHFESIHQVDAVALITAGRNLK